MKKIFKINVGQSTYSISNFKSETDIIEAYLEIKNGNSLIGNLINYTARKNFGNEDSINEFYSSTKLFNDLNLIYKGKEYELFQVFTSKYNDEEHQILYIGNCKES